MKVLFAVVDGGGNIPPQLGVARALRSRGVQVRFLGHDGVADRLRDAGFDFESFSTGTQFDPCRRSRGTGVMGGIARVITDRRFSRDIIAAARHHGADVVVVDMLLTAASADVVAAGLPTVVFVHCFYRAVQDAAAGPLGWLLRLRGVRPLGAEHNGALQIVAARADLDPVRGVPPVHHVGVVWQGVPTQSQPRPVPHVLISLSTCAYAGQRRMLQHILDAVEGLPIRAAVTVGPAIDGSGLRVPANATIHRWLDHDEVLATASLVIGHGGHSTAMRALSFGVPLVIMPANGLIDQKRVGAAIQRAGAGMLLPKSAGAQRIRAAVTAVLGDQRYREAAGLLGEQIRRRDGAEAAADAICRLVKTPSC
ncbi:glycosyltransferase [Mycobacterium asiaticum]|nr:nucleotide disphospho-sugar-binding domain-containing protein [Mycobacterium asiaticum]